jgi:hypothetical protein
MTADSSHAVTPSTPDPSAALLVALIKSCGDILETKRLLGNKAVPRSIIQRQLEIIEARVETAYRTAELQDTALQDLTRMAEALQTAYDELFAHADSAYQQGYQDALKEVLANRADNELVIAWLLHVLDTAQIREFLDAHDEE